MGLAIQMNNGIKQAVEIKQQTKCGRFDF